MKIVRTKKDADSLVMYDQYIIDVGLSDDPEEMLKEIKKLALQAELEKIIEEKFTKES